MDKDDEAYWERWRTKKWDAYVGASCSQEIYARNKLEAAALVVKTLISSLSQDAGRDVLQPQEQVGDDMSKFLSVAKIILIIQLIVNHLLEDLDNKDFMRIFNVFATTLNLDAAEIFSSKRAVFSQLLTMSAPSMMTEFEQLALDYCAIIVPRSMAIDLSNAMAALKSGEVQEIVRPEPRKKQGESWTWDQERLKACQHVFFLKGKGLTKKKAQTRVCEASGIGVETLRSYEAKIKKQDHHYHTLEAAEKAGDYMQRHEADPNLAIDSVLDAQAISILHQLLTEPLAAFGPRYRRLHGARHNQVSGVSG